MADIGRLPVGGNIVRFQSPADFLILRQVTLNLFLDFLHPAVTRISQPTKEISQLAVKILMERLSDKQSVPQQIKLPAQIIEGKSVKRL